MKFKITTAIYLISNIISAIYVGVNAKNLIQAVGVQIAIGLTLSAIYFAFAYKQLKK